jgi:hypothetical protein
MANSELQEITFRIDWDGLGSLHPFNVPLLFPDFERILAAYPGTGRPSETWSRAPF